MAQSQDETQRSEIVAPNIRIVYPARGDGPFTLEVLLDSRWTPGVNYETIEDARRAALKLASDKFRSDGACQ